MSPTSGDDDTVDGDESGGKPEEAAVADATQKQAAKRRTKTGCLSEYLRLPFCSAPLVTIDVDTRHKHVASDGSNVEKKNRYALIFNCPASSIFS